MNGNNISTSNQTNNVFPTELCLSQIPKIPPATPILPTVRGRGDGRARDWKVKTKFANYVTMLRPE